MRAIEARHEVAYHRPEELPAIVQDGAWVMRERMARRLMPYSAERETMVGEMGA